MELRVERTRDVALPASALSALGRALRTNAGPLPAMHGLHAAGYEAGEAFFADFTRGLEASLAGLTTSEFFRSLAGFLERRGWGHLRHESAHPGVGLLRSADWAEAEGAESGQPSCAFTVGLLSHLLSRVTDTPVAVLEVTCRASRAEGCTFAFGSGAAIHELYDLLIAGETIEGALARL